MIRGLNVDIAGKIRKIKSKNPLLPLFEAVVNSIQAINAIDDGNGKISIVVHRENKHDYIKLGDVNIPEVIGFTIVDNGIGFNDSNYTSFCTSDSTLKVEEGGKGIGRFSWLKFFENVHIKSVFQEQSCNYQRQFKFDMKGIDNGDKQEVLQVPVETKIHLYNFRKEFAKECPKNSEIIASRLVEHLLSYFATSSCPTITLLDGEIQHDLELLFHEQFGESKKISNFELGRKSFQTSGFRVYEGNQVHSIFLCAHKRVVRKIPLQKSNPMLGRKLEDRDGRNFAYWIYVEGEYLNDNVDEDREGFKIPASNEGDFDFGELSLQKIVDETLSIIFEDLSEELTQVKETNRQRIEQYINESAPEYKTLLKLHPEKLSLISKSSEKEIDTELRRILYEIEVKVRRDTQKILKMPTDTQSSLDDFEAKTNEILSIINDVGKASLSKYIIQRRVILDILKKRMEFNEIEKFHLESSIHELIFPLQDTSEGVPFEKQNLWIIDERLSYHSYLASDKTLESLPIDNAPASKKRPDIIIFNNPIALDNRTEMGRPFESIEIIEFKKPGRDDYTDSDNPYLQVIKYIELIQEGKEKSNRGRPIEVTANTHYYCYIMCDVTGKLKKILKRYSFKETPDGQGLFCFAESHNAYIEVISYNKMLRLAEQRNRVLFDKLQIKY